jgi:hypothetical protein
MAISFLNRRVSEGEEVQTEAAWNAGERGSNPLVAAAARARERAEAAYEVASERARQERSPQAEAAERDLALARNQARHLWRVLYLEVEGVARAAAASGAQRKGPGCSEAQGEVQVSTRAETPESRARFRRSTPGAALAPCFAL